MALISDSTFDPLARYVNVRLQQGVPIVDADLNELDDIRQFELRAFLKWFVGDGVPDGNDGFRIAGTGDANDFAIRAGRQLAGPGDALEQGLHRVGRIIVDGLDVMIAKDVTFAEQPLHEKVAGSDALAARLGVRVVEQLAAPAADGTVAAYLDVWQTLVTADDEGASRLRHEGLGIETCARVRRDWAVRVRPGTGAPQRDDPDFVAGHSYSLLAVIDRRKGDGTVRREDVVDRRHQRLQLAPATLVEDVMGGTATDYRAGLRRPPISFRDALNALLHGELPMSQELEVAQSPAGKTDEMSRAFLRDRDNGLVAVFRSDRDGSSQIYATRMRLDAIDQGFDPVVKVTAAVDHSQPSVAELPDGSLFVAYQTGFVGNADIHAKQGRLADLASAPELPVVVAPGVFDMMPVVVASGLVVTVFFHKKIPGATPDQDVNRWHFRRWRLDQHDWIGEATPLNEGTDHNRAFHAAVAADGKIWVAYTSKEGVIVAQVDPGTGAASQRTKIGNAVQNATSSPFVLCPRTGGAWVFWQNSGLFANRIEAAPLPASTSKLDRTDTQDSSPCAVEDADGKIWLVWSRARESGGHNIDIVIQRRDDRGVWGDSRQLVANQVAITSPDLAALGENTAPMAVAGKDTTVMVFWSNAREGQPKIYGKRFVTAV